MNKKFFVAQYRAKQRGRAIRDKVKGTIIPFAIEAEDGLVKGVKRVREFKEKNVTKEEGSFWLLLAILLISGIGIACIAACA